MSRTPAEDRNLAFVREMYETMLMPMDADLVDHYIAEDYVQHSQFAEPGREALKDFLRMIRKESPDAVQTIHRMFADGDYVIVHVEVKRFPDDPGLAVADMFRLADGKIAEHWEVIQEIPTVSPNPLTMFGDGE